MKIKIKQREGKKIEKEEEFPLQQSCTTFLYCFCTNIPMQGGEMIYLHWNVCTETVKKSRA